MVIDLSDTYRMIMTMETQNGHNSANFEATTFRFCMVIDINEMYRMMMTMMTTMMMMIMMMRRMMKMKLI